METFLDVLFRVYLIVGIIMLLSSILDDDTVAETIVKSVLWPLYVIRDITRIIARDFYKGFFND